MTLLWTPRARRELYAQLDFMALDKPGAADRMAALVEKSTGMLEDWPRLGTRGRVAETFELAISQTPFIAV